MLRIRFSPRGKRNYPTYRVVVMEKHRAIDGKYVEDVGSYNPHTKEFTLNQERISYWQGCGARPTMSVESLLKLSEGKESGSRPKREGFVKKTKKQKEAEKAAEEKPTEKKEVKEEPPEEKKELVEDVKKEVKEQKAEKAEEVQTAPVTKEEKKEA